MTETIINSEQALKAYKFFLDQQFEQHKYLHCKLTTGRTRTNTQNAALHLYFKMLAEALNEAGFEYKYYIFDTEFEIPWTPELVKIQMWKPIQEKLTSKKSTTEPKTYDYGDIYDVLNRALARHNIYVPWPSKDEL